MIGDITLDQLITQIGWPAILVIARVMGIFSILPVFGDTIIPVRFRAAMGVSFGIAFAVFLSPQGTITHLTFPVTALITEILVGVSIGLGFRLMVHAIQTAGAIAAQSFALSQIAGALNNEPLPAVGYFMLLSSLSLLLALGFGENLVALVAQSFQIWPTGFIPNGGQLVAIFLPLVAFSFSLALKLAIPFCTVSLLYNVILGAANKVMPQLMVMLVGAPVGMLAILGVLAIAGPLIAGIWVKTVFSMLDLTWVKQ
ncbi:flagellar biosynthetic protein FliR [Rhodobacteraceae bacterium]|nr:flagellar biosynthetic protein FliR [Paracoccaceae bacterium]